MSEPEGDWELVTDCETAGVIDGKTDLPVRSHPYLAPGMVVAVNRDALPGPLDLVHRHPDIPVAVPRRVHNCRFAYCTAPTGASGVRS